MGNLVCCKQQESAPEIQFRESGALDRSKTGPISKVTHPQPVMYKEELKETPEESETLATIGSVNISTPKSQSQQSIKIRRSQLLSSRKGKLSDFFLIKEQLGTGAFGSVYRAIDKKSQEVRAVKTIVLPDDQSRVQRMLEEVDILKTLDHPNILTVYETILEDNKLHIVTELCTGGELFDRIIESGHFSENQAARIMFDIMKAVMYCHRFGIVHRDIKPENLLFETRDPDSLIKVIDFGTSKKMKPNTKLRTLMGTVRLIQAYYIAPEVLLGYYDEKCDIWSCGVILYILLCKINSRWIPSF
jgi:calcium-dependent protein kinase